MKTKHILHIGDSRSMAAIADNTIDLVVTSPPYPMIEMWDTQFIQMNPAIQQEFDNGKGQQAFELMHRELDMVWVELSRVVKPGGFVCINIGDATRTVAKNFSLYSNHSRISNYMTSLSFQALPIILWKKSTNAPNKFMGSGMLPAGAYVTLEHEYILIFRKGFKREFKSEAAKKIRRESALFWEERNIWFSDSWDLTGVRQKLQNKLLRQRSAAFPLELPFRLINMYSVKGDTVLDPFSGTGTSVVAAIVSARNAIGIEFEPAFNELVLNKLQEIKILANKRIDQRIIQHQNFISHRKAMEKEIKHSNHVHGFPVITRQEQGLTIDYVHSISLNNKKHLVAEYKPMERVENHAID